MEYEILINDQKLAVEISEDKITVDGKEINAEISEQNGTFFIHQEKNISKANVIEKNGNQIKLLINGKTQELVVHDHITMLLDQLGMADQLEDKADQITAPMPGSIMDIMVKEGEEVQEGQALLILEAMKMENLIKAPTSATIKKINIQKGDSVEKNATLIEFE